MIIEALHLPNVRITTESGHFKYTSVIISITSIYIPAILNNHGV